METLQECPNHPEPIFEFGVLIYTGKANALDQVIGGGLLPFFWQHVTGYYGDLSWEDWIANDRAVRNGGRVLSAYDTGHGRIVIITNANRELTTVMLQEEVKRYEQQ